jgi:anionic cell wall polymer biosynthesis LytR-Cps2A-Psr (LCP) family protein
MMVHMPVINEKGKEHGSFYGQLGYSHTFDTGMEDSCENARKTVSNLLYGLEIDHYFALNMDAIGILNDAVGGVTVNITDDFSPVDPTMVKGLYTLRGEQARTFVQSRMIIGDGLNLSRMRRQEEYMRGFVSALMEKLQEDDSVILQAYEDIADYTVTDCSAAVLSRLAKDFEGYTLGEMYSIKGENREGEVYMEFYHDEEALDALILELFYAPKK